MSSSCPFCEPTEDDVVALETVHARAICDARPAAVGHMLIVPKAHLPSSLDLDPLNRAHLDVLQQEVVRRLQRKTGTVGVYEHGRSRMCRFHDVPVGYCHAHMHVLPASFDFVKRANYGSTWTREPSAEVLGPNARYLFQEIGDSPIRKWAVGNTPVPRHFVRAEFEASLAEFGHSWIPLGLSPDDYDEAIRQTAAIFTEPSSKAKGIAVFVPSDQLRWEISIKLAARLKWRLIDLSLLMRLVAWTNNKSNAGSVSDYVEQFRASLLMNTIFSFDSTLGTPTAIYHGENVWTELHQPEVDNAVDELQANSDFVDQFKKVITAIADQEPLIVLANSFGQLLENVPLTKVIVFNDQTDLSKPVSGYLAGWQDFRLNVTGLTSDDSSALIAEALDLSMRQGTAANF